MLTVVMWANFVLKVQDNYDMLDIAGNLNSDSVCQQQNSSANTRFTCA